jgi:hypothetical protein
MEVHPPEHPIFTWKQFFIHMSTVCLGLLIALGLEQGVEALHRHHQRHQLEADLRAEGIRNLHNAILALEFSDRTARWQSQQAQELDRAATQGCTPAYIPPPPARAGHFSRPSDAVWTVAQSSSTLNLLPRSEAERYAHPYFDVHLASEYLQRLNELGQEREAVLDAAAVDPPTGLLARHMNATYDLSRLSKEQLAHFREITGTTIVAARSEAAYTLTMYALTWGTLNGYSDDENTARRTEVNAAYFHGGTAELLEKFPIPDEKTAATTEDKWFHGSPPARSPHHDVEAIPRSHVHHLSRPAHRAWSGTSRRVRAPQAYLPRPSGPSRRPAHLTCSRA